ncbi:hypothetical protein QE177_10165 [Arsenophonus sp. aPb]|uniref:hypothetical protein n=1 Tax=Arsenophonus sp. aPb TaxID=3041619 RepID=UPI002469370B|nr:hypothetical protein [Arsenophonus sp. aPb]WGL97568.1 hypothetical protein QE177_10165 [Arsenophonus sp. aPb]
MLIKQVTLNQAVYSDPIVSSRLFNGRNVSVDRQIEQNRPLLSEMLPDLTVQQQQHLARLVQGTHSPLATRHIEVL